MAEISLFRVLLQYRTLNAVFMTKRGLLCMLIALLGQLASILNREAILLRRQPTF